MNNDPIDLDRDEILNISKNLEIEWSGSLSGECIIFLDEANELISYVRVAFKHETGKVVFIDKERLNLLIITLLDYNKVKEVIDKRKENTHTDYIEYYFEVFRPIIDKLNFDYDSVYVNFFDYIIEYITKNE